MRSRHVAICGAMTSALSSVMLLFLLMSPSAMATWGKNCSTEALHHCYAIAEWQMTGSGNGGGEEVRGLSSEIVTSAMGVPAWYDGDFVTNEQWMAQKGDKWIEDGQLAGVDSPTEEGREVNGESLHWFYASNNGSWKEYVAPWTYPGWTYESYTLEDRALNGTWCPKMNAVWVTCETGFDKYATKVSVGMEASDEIQPVNAGWDRTGVENPAGEWEHWSKAYWITQNNFGESESGVTCVEGYESIAGYISFGTPANKCFS